MERKQDELVAASKADPDRGFMARLMGTSAAKQMLPLIHLSGGCGSRVPPHLGGCMKPLFSEFSYGYAVTEDIVRSNNPLKAAPIFPSLRNEGTQGGFDVKLDLPGSPLFLQFQTL